MPIIYITTLPAWRSFENNITYIYIHHKYHKWAWSCTHEINRRQKYFVCSFSLFKSSICLHFHYALCVPEDASTHFEISLKSWTKSNNQMPKTIGHHIKIFYRAQISCDFVCHYDDIIYGDTFNVSHSWPSVTSSPGKLSTTGAPIPLPKAGIWGTVDAFFLLARTNNRDFILSN